MYKVKKLIRFITIYGIGRTLFKVFGRLRVSTFRLPSLKKRNIGLIGCGQFGFATIGYFISKKSQYNFLRAFDIDKKHQKSYCVVLPYTKGTNSGIPSTVLSLGTKLITSDIDMFKNNEIIDKNFIFNNEDSDSLNKIFMQSIYMNYNYLFLNNYIKEFNQKINELFEKQLNKEKICVE